jgi:RluA family pseudouridine synthase
MESEDIVDESLLSVAEVACGRPGFLSNDSPVTSTISQSNFLSFALPTDQPTMSVYKDNQVDAAGDDRKIVNIAAYQFTQLDRLPERREELRTLCRSLQIKGTILLSPEGINLFLAGSRESVNKLVAHLREDSLLAGLETKESFSRRQPFRRLLVKLKKEIIAFGVKGVAPAAYTSKKLSATRLKQWLDEGRPLTLLDTRNDYEVRIGTFKAAIPIGIDHFRDFPSAIQRLPAQFKQQPIVMFCTGGIRCEKAGPFMEQEGFREIYQLQGGILKYFEECGGEHYEGDCFVFDQRVAINPRLEETATTQCYACQHPLTPKDQESARYVVGVSCPFCWRPLATQSALPLAERESKIAAVTSPLPGAGPYENLRPLNVPARYDRLNLLDFLSEFLPNMSRKEWEAVIQQGLIRDSNGSLSVDRVLRGGQRLVRVEPATTEPPVNTGVRILAWEDDYVVFDKPAPLPMHPCGRFNRNTLTKILGLAFPGEKFSPAHRLDANTTGIVVFTRNRKAARAIQRQFERGEASKTYLCRVVGHPSWEEMISRERIASKPLQNGFRVIDEKSGDSAETVFRVVFRRPNGEAIIEAIPRTGRTNQIRIHLWSLGYPVVGDPAYLPQQQLGAEQTLAPGSPPMCLHAWRLAFARPVDDATVAFETKRPLWAM